MNALTLFRLTQDTRACSDAELQPSFFEGGRCRLTPDQLYDKPRFLPVTGGQLSGGCFCGALLPRGSDCQRIRPDFVAKLGVRLVIQTDDGVHILMESLGMRHGACVAHGVIIDVYEIL